MQVAAEKYSRGRNGQLGNIRGPYGPNCRQTPRKLAKLNNDLYYTPDKLCSKGHQSLRRTSDGACLDCESIKRTRLYYKDKELTNRKQRQYKQAHPEQQKQYRKDRLEKERPLRRVREAKRNSLKRNAEGSFTIEDINNLLLTQNGLCTVCKIKLTESGYHIDHKIPLVRGGSNWPDNLQLLCPHDNVSKNSLTDDEYRQRLGL
jgi:5-methylcytosine-specific restriction endonuclease McrA